MDDIKNKSIDCCIDLTSDYNVSRIIYYILKNKYRYIGEKKWEYYNSKDTKWYIDVNNKYLKNDIETIICNEFLYRIQYWENISNESYKNDIDLNNTCQLKINKLLICSNKLKDKKYIITIIKEASALFEYENKSINK